ncbi:helix-turn-helix domain-containing protein [Vibrio sp. ZSDZ65]|uniref:Helix-turn-helix domain-containing protein n=1 Tax=Vibrio qingdaonensis TaxID=2829491 RepID=A0A9X3CLJ8_9VIBR|nr:helix-turn-helix transcriptional regulator [Vibrio qingdaonensis]MCW8345466.1 helix-turn-helix domain-containing protein [Vibrio qingdaonensis]
MSELNLAICKEIKQRLKQSGWSYKNIAEQLGTSEVSIKRLLNGQSHLSVSKLNEICELIKVPLSKVITTAEDAIKTVSLFTSEQDSAFYDKPELYTIFHEIVNENANSSQLMTVFNLNEPSTYLYLRSLEKLNLIKMLKGSDFVLQVPKSTAFSEQAKFPLLFKNCVIESVQKHVQVISPNDKNAYFITCKLRLTQQEFSDYNLKLEQLMFEALRLSQTRNSATPNTQEYTIIDMAAKGVHHPKLALPKNIASDLT